MLNNFLVCFNAILPLVIYLLIGFGVRKADLVTLDQVRAFNHMVFVVFFPVMMFDSLYTSDIEAAFDIKFVGFALVFLMCFITVDWAFSVRIESDNRSRGALIQAIYRSNYVLMGIPVAVNIFGKGNIPEAAVLAMVMVPVYNVMAVIILEKFRGGKADARHLIKGVAKNPIILGALAGLIAVGLDISLPEAVKQVCDTMGSATTPIAMILLGASFDIKSVKSGKRNLTLAVLGKLVVQPALGLPIAVALGFRGIQLVALIIMMAAPTAVSSYTMAEAMDSDGHLAGNAVIFSTPISCVTLFLWLFIFKSLAMF